MMLPVAMRRLNVFVDHRDIERTTAILAEQEQLHLADPRDEQWREEASHWSELSNRLADRAHRLADLLHALDVRPIDATAPARLSPSEDSEEIDAALEEIEREVGAWRERKAENERRINRLSHLLSEMELLSGLEVPVNEIRHPDHLHWKVGTVPAERLEHLDVILYRVSFVIIPLQEREGRTLIIAVSSRQHAEMLEQALRGVFFEGLDLPQDLVGRPADIGPQLEDQLEQARQRRQELEARQERLARRYRHRLLALRRAAAGGQQVAKAITRFGRHGDTFLIAGWVPEDKVSEILVALENATGGRADVETIEPPRTGPRRVPTLIRNPRFVRPFQVVVSTFGFPDYGEVDPTLLVAISFTLMYGMMFGDVGHGAMLVAAGLGLRWYKKGKGTAPAFGAVLAAAGVSGMLFGMLYGSVFGREDILPHLWLRPLERITELLAVSVAGGIVLINIGFALNLLKAWRKADWGGLFLAPSGVAGIGLYWALMGGGYAVFHDWLAPAALAALILLPAALLYFREPLGRLVARERPLLEGGWGAFGVQAAFELLEIVVRYISNTLSFVRLGAFAVAHAAFMGVIFALAGDAGGVAGWGIIVIGTLLVVGLEGLIVGIQALRLEYYEFFGRFYDGGGRGFEPLRLLPDGEAQAIQRPGGTS